MPSANSGDLVSETAPTVAVLGLCCTLLLTATRGLADQSLITISPLVHCQILPTNTSYNGSPDSLTPSLLKLSRSISIQLPVPPSLYNSSWNLIPAGSLCIYTIGLNTCLSCFNRWWLYCHSAILYLSVHWQNTRRFYVCKICIIQKSNYPTTVLCIGHMLLFWYEKENLS